MTNAELLAWGETENTTRKAELAGVKSQVDLKRVQDDAAKRRKAVGLSRSAAARWVKEAQIQVRR